MKQIKTSKLRVLPFVVMLFACIAVNAQQISVSGTVSENTGEPIIGATVSQTGTSNATMTDANGNYTLNVPGDGTLTVSFVGYSQQTINVNGRNVINITLLEDATQLQEVVAIGYGTVQRKDVTTSISSVTTRDINERPIISTGQAIQGRAAGVYVVQPNGAPGGETVIRVRGTTSMNADNSPLYVVDGVPVDNMNFLAPTDIADIQVMKDAAASAIYGSRGANGVVMITTKSGSEGKARVSLNTSYGLRMLSNPIKSLNAADYKDLMEELNPGSSANMGTEDITDWYKETYQTGETMNYQLSISRQKDDLNYYISLGYLDEKGIISAAWFKRYSFRAKIDDKVFNWLKIGANISYSDNSQNGINTGNGSNRGGVVLSVVNLPTSLPVINPETNYYNRMFYGQNITNPVEAIANGKNNSNTENRLIASGMGQILFTKHLDLKSTLSIDRRNAWESGYTPIVHVEGFDQYGNGWDNRNMNTVMTMDNIATYQNNFAKHALTVMAGTSYTSSFYTNSWINGSDYKSDDIKTLNAANNIAWDNTGTGASDWKMMSYMGRISYNYDSKYLLTANIRADGSSRLHPGHQWGYFPSASAAWRISSESFMQNVKWIDDLKLRGGWGQTGNQSGLGEYAYLQRYSITRQKWWVTGELHTVPSIEAINLSSPNLTWETTTASGVGIDLSVLKNILSVTADWYYKLTTNMLMFVNLPQSGNLIYLQRNGGSMVNKGWEFAITSHNFRKKFIWDTNFNISFNRNKLTKLEFVNLYDDGITSDAFHGMRMVRNVEGRSIGGFYGLICDGVNPETGELMYRDLNKDGKISASDYTFIGDPNPDFVFGMTNTLSWQNFDLSIFIQGSYGNDILNASKVEIEGMRPDKKNQSVEVLKRWRTPGQITDVPKANFDLRPSSYFIEDGSYIRLKDLTLAYNFDSELLRKIGVSKIQPYVTLTNLVTITKYSGMDPEVNQWGNSWIQGIDWGTYPQSRSYTFGLNIEF